MYSLVKFNNDELQVVPTKRVQIGKGKQCTVNWKGSKYTADILKLHDSKDILEKEIENLKTKKTKKEKKRRNLLRVELTDVLDVNKAQNNSSRIISDIVVSERQPVHNKNEDIEDENLANVSKILENAVGSRETNDNDKCSNTFDQSTSSSTENNRIDKSVPSLKRSPPIIITDDSVSSESDELSHETNESEDKPIKKLLKRRRRIVSDDSLSDSKQQMERIEEENDPESDSFTDGTHRRSTSPFGKTKRIRWNSDEKSAIADCFGDPTKCSKLPSLNACFEATKTYTALKRRTPQQIKTWIDNQRKAKSRLEAYKLKSRKS